MSSERKIRWRFHLAVGAFVVVASFLYGFQSGLRGRIEKARASISPEQLLAYDPELTTTLPARIDLPSETVAAPMGREMRLNSRSIDAVNFYSRRTVESLLREQARKWEAQGLFTVGTGTRKRGVAMAIDPASQERYSMVAWIVPPAFRETSSNGYPVQGIYSVADSNPAGESQLEESRGEVPGVPLPSGGKGGAIFSSLDPGGRSYSGVYTNLGSIRENQDYYRAMLEADGWREQKIGGEMAFAAPVTVVEFTRDRESIELFFSALPSRGEGGEKTVVTVLRHPKILIGGVY